jgi:hypothetical protein
MASRLTPRFQFYYTETPRGWRYWSQISPLNWQERYDTGTTIFVFWNGRW